MQPTNVLEPVIPVAEIDPMDAASNPTAPVFELWGKVEASAWYCGFTKVVGRVPYDPNTHKNRSTAVDLFIVPLPEQAIDKPKSCEDNLIAEDKDYREIVWASAKALGINNLRELNGKYARVEKVNGKPYYEKGADGKPAKFNADGTAATPKGYERHFKFVAFYADEAACRTAYFAAGNTDKSAVNTPVMVSFNPDGVATMDNSAAERVTALAFLNVIVPNAIKGKVTADEKKLAIATTLTQYPTVNKFFSADSPEVLALIASATV